jgi:hypothetical protein
LAATAQADRRHCYRLGAPAGHSRAQGPLRLQFAEYAESGLPAVLFQDKLIHVSKRSVLFGAIVANDVAHATNPSPH